MLVCVPVLRAMHRIRALTVIGTYVHSRVKVSDVFNRQGIDVCLAHLIPL